MPAIPLQLITFKFSATGNPSLEQCTSSYITFGMSDLTHHFKGARNKMHSCHGNHCWNPRNCKRIFKVRVDPGLTKGKKKKILYVIWYGDSSFTTWVFDALWQICAAFCTVEVNSELKPIQPKQLNCYLIITLNMSYHMTFRV